MFNTFWGKTQWAHSTMMPVQSGVCVLSLVVEVSPEKIKNKVQQRQFLN